MNRRGFLSAILAAGAAPYVMSSGVAKGILMPVREIIKPSQEILRVGAATVTTAHTLSLGDVITIAGQIYPKGKLKGQLMQFTVTSVDSNGSYTLSNPYNV
jgi:hypothetical protein